MLRLRRTPRADKAALAVRAGGPGRLKRGLVRGTWRAQSLEELCAAAATLAIDPDQSEPAGGDWWSRLVEISMLRELDHTQLWNERITLIETIEHMARVRGAELSGGWEKQRIRALTETGCPVALLASSALGVAMIPEPHGLAQLRERAGERWGAGVVAACLSERELLGGSKAATGPVLEAVAAACRSGLRAAEPSESRARQEQEQARLWLRLGVSWISPADAPKRTEPTWRGRLIGPLLLEREELSERGVGLAEAVGLMAEACAHEAELGAAALVLIEDGVAIESAISVAAAASAPARTRA